MRHRLVRPGDRSEFVRQLKRIFLFTEVDDFYSDDLLWHVRGVQRGLNVPADGVIDEAVLKQMNLL